MWFGVLCLQCWQCFVGVFLLQCWCIVVVVQGFVQCQYQVWMFGVGLFQECIGDMVVVVEVLFFFDFVWQCLVCSGIVYVVVVVCVVGDVFYQLIWYLCVVIVWIVLYDVYGFMGDQVDVVGVLCQLIWVDGDCCGLVFVIDEGDFGVVWVDYDVYY